MDVISVISKRNYDDTPHANFNDTIAQVYANGPRIHEFLKEMNREVMSHYDVMTVGEGPGIDLDTGLQYVAEDEKELNMLFHFGHMFMDHGPGGRFDPKPIDFVEFKKIFQLWDEKFKSDGWGSIFLGNHDFQRIVSRFGNDADFWEESAKLLCLMLMTMRGTPYVYQGDEIGMTNVAFDRIEDYDDVEIMNAYAEWKAQGKDLDLFLKHVHVNGRDNARTPIQWDATENAGFTSATPWLKLNPNYTKINVADQQNAGNSILNFYRQMISIRKANPSLVYANYAVINEAHKQVYAYWRWDDAVRYLILLNFSADQQTFEVDDRFDIESLSLIIGNMGAVQMAGDKIFELLPWQAALYQL